MEHQTQPSNAVHKRPNYLGVFVGLGILTAIEIGITRIPGFDPRAPLFALMTAKVVLVAMYYMHLRSDSRWFTVLILAPIPFVVLILAALMLRTLP